MDTLSDKLLLTSEQLDKLFEGFDGDPKDYKVSIHWGNPVEKNIMFSIIN